MRRPFFLLCLALCLAAAPLRAAPKLDLARVVPVPASQQIPVADFFRPALLESPRLSLNGTYMAALVTVAQDRQDLLIYNLDKKSAQTVSAAQERDAYGLRWLNDTKLMYMLGTEKLYGMGMMVLDVRAQTTYPLIQFYNATLVGIPERNRLRPLVWMRSDFMRNGRDLGVANVKAELDLGGFANLWGTNSGLDAYQKVETLNEKHIATSYPLPPGLASAYLADKEGELAFAFTGDAGGFISLYRYAGGTWEKSPIDLDEIDVIAAGDRPGEVIVNGPFLPGKPRALQRFDVASGQLGEVLHEDSGYEFDGRLFRDSVSHEIVGAFYDRAGPHVVWFDAAYREIQKLLNASFPEQVVRIIDGDKTGRLLVAAYSDRQPPVYHWVDPKKREAGLIKSSAPWIDPSRMRPTNMMKFKTGDGRELDAYVTLPEGASQKTPVPLVVLPHGGPWVRDTWGFDGEVQFLASRGYAVLQPNYRGSTGYDWMFPGEDQYAFRKMHDDVTAATKALLASRLIDSKRVAIMGSSFGGYLALCGAVHEPNLYRCAVTVAGVFDWEILLKDKKSDRYRSGWYASLKRKLGDPEKEKEKFDLISPLRHVEQIRAPVFVAHGKEDRVAEVGESQRLVAELKKYNLPHEVLLVGGEGHGMAHLTNRVELYTRIEAFLGKYLAPARSEVSATAP